MNQILCGVVLVGLLGGPFAAWAQSSPQLQRVTPGSLDGSTATAGSTGAYSLGGVYDDTMANCATGKSCLVRITPARGLHLNLRNSSGTEVGTAGNPLRIDPTGSTTQPVSGTVSVSGTVTISGTVVANQGGSPWSMRLQDGAAGTLATITAGNALKVDGSGVTQPVSGTVTANAGSGPFPNQQSNITLDYDSGGGTQSLTLFGLALPGSGGAVAGGTGTNPLRTDPTGTTTQPVSGTVAISGTVAVTQSGPWSMRAQDGAGNALTSAARGAERALTVQIVDASGAQVTTFGGAGGTSSNYGSAFPSAGTAVGFKDSSGTNLAAGNLDASGNLKVNVAAGGGAGGTSSSFGAAFPATGTAGGFSDGTNMQAGRAIDVDSGAGTVYAQGVNLLKRASGGPVEAATASDPLRIDPTGTTVQPVSAASLPLPSGAATAAKQPAVGTAGTAATDVLTVQGIAGMTKLLVTPDSVALPANQSVNVSQINGVTPLMGNGVTGTGSQRVTIASDNTAFTVNIGTFPDNEPINVAQINGVAVSMGNGVSGTGVQRVTLASDSTGTVAVTQATAANLNMRPDTSGATGAAPPARANYVGGLASGATGGFVSGLAVCDSFANVNVSTATTTLLVTGVSGRHVRICSLSLVSAGANNVALLSGTGATCGTGTTGMSGGTTAASGWNFAANSGITQGSGLGTVNQTNATGDSVCIATSAATQLSGRIAYAVY